MADRLFTRRHGAAGLALYVGAALLLLAGLAAIPAIKAVHGFASLVLSVTALVGVFGAPFVYKLARRLRQKLFADLPAFDVCLKQRGESLFVFLREFNSDAEPDYTDQDPFGDLYVTEEEKIAGHFLGFGAVVAIGRPGERLPCGGSYRMYVGDDCWKDVVGQLIDRADLVLLRCGDTPGVSWEVEQVAARGKLDRLVLITSKKTENNLATYKRLSAFIAPPRTPAPLEDVLSPPAMEALRDRTEQQLRETLAGFSEEDSLRASVQRMLDAVEKGRLSDERFRLSARVSAARVYRVFGGRLEPVPGPLTAALNELTRLLALKPHLARRLKNLLVLAVALSVPLLAAIVMGCHWSSMCGGAEVYALYAAFAVVLLMVVGGMFLIVL